MIEFAAGFILYIICGVASVAILACGIGAEELRMDKDNRQAMVRIGLLWPVFWAVFLFNYVKSLLT